MSARAPFTFYLLGDSPSLEFLARARVGGYLLKRRQLFSDYTTEENDTPLPKMHTERKISIWGN